MRRLRPLVAPALLLSVGLGVAAAALSLRRALDASSLPYPHADRLVTLIAGSKSWSGPMLDAVRERTTIFDALSLIQERAATLGGDAAEVIRIETVSSAYFDLLGVHASLGATFGADDDRRDAPGSGGVISDALWQRRFNADPLIVGRSIELDRRRVVVLGVMPRGFRGLIGRTDVWIPLGTSRWIDGETGPEQPWSRGYELFGRLRAGADIAEAEPRYAAEARAAIESTGAAFRILGANGRLRLVPMAAARVSPQVAQATWVLAWASLAVLVFVVVSVTSLAWLRGEQRMHELGVRIALGASRWQLATMAFREAAVVAALAAAGALMVRPLLLAAVMSIRPPSTTFGIVTSELIAGGVARMDVWATALVAIGAVLGTLPLVLAVVWSARARTAGAGLRGGRIEGGLSRWRSAGLSVIAVQAAVACLVLSGAMLMTRATSQLFGADRGYDWSGVSTARVSLPDGPYSAANAGAFYERVVARLAAMPGVAHASVSSCAPGAGRCRQSNVSHLDGRELTHDAQVPIGITFVTAGHLRTIGAAITRGRDFDENDRAGVPLTVIVSQPLAARLWPGGDPVGRTLGIYTANGSLAGERVVVGVVDPIQFGTDPDGGGDVFLPASQVAWTSAVVFAKSSLSGRAAQAAIAEAVAEVDRGVPVHDAASLEERLGRSLGAELFLLRTLAAFGIAALVLAAIGAYATASHAVTRSRREIGVRMALGASAPQIWSLVGRRGVLVGLVGAATGLAGAFVSGQLLASMLHGLSARDPIALTLAPLVTVGGLVLAIAVPAWRASVLSPTTAMREP